MVLKTMKEHENRKQAMIVAHMRAKQQKNKTTKDNCWRRNTQTTHKNLGDKQLVDINTVTDGKQQKQSVNNEDLAYTN